VSHQPSTTPDIASTVAVPPAFRSARSAAPSPSPALLRLRRRRGQRGATIFVVTMVMVLLTAMGIFAARAAALTQQASGFERLSEQTHYVMEEGMYLATAEIARGTDAYLQPVSGNASLDPTCFGNIGLAAADGAPAAGSNTYKCAKFTFAQLSSATNTAQKAQGFPEVPPLTAASSTDIGTADPGSLGHALVSPRFYVEMTDIGPAARKLPGFAAGGTREQFDFVQVTLGGWGQITPYQETGVCGATEQQASYLAARETGRAQVIIGPRKR
jgi:hypothetical protein